MARWTAVQEVEHRHGYLRGGPREQFLLNLLETAREVDEREAQQSAQRQNSLTPSQTPATPSTSD